MICIWVLGKYRVNKLFVVNYTNNKYEKKWILNNSIYCFFYNKNKNFILKYNSIVNYYKKSFKFFTLNNKFLQNNNSKNSYNWINFAMDTAL